MGKKLTGILSLVKPKSGEPAGSADETIALAKDAPSEEVVTTKDTPGEEVDNSQEDTPAEEVIAAKESSTEKVIIAKDAPAEEVVTTAAEEPPVPETCESPRTVEAVKVESSSSDVSTSMGKKTLAAIISFAKRKNTTSEPGGATAAPSTKDATVAGGQDTTTSVSEEADPPATESAKAELSTSEGTSVRKSLTAILNLTKRKSTVSEPAGTIDAPGKDGPTEEAAATVGSEAPEAEATGTPVVEGAKNESSASDGTSTSMGKRFAGILNLKKRRSSSFSESIDVAEPSPKDVPVEEVVAAVADVTSATTEEGPKDDPPVSDVATPRTGKRLTLSDILHLTRRKNNNTSEAASDTVAKNDSAEGAVVTDTSTSAAGLVSKDAQAEVALAKDTSAEDAISKHVPAEEAVTSSSCEAPVIEAAPTPTAEAVKSEPSSPGMGKRLTDILHIKRRKNNSISEPADAPAIVSEEPATAIRGEVPLVAETAATPIEGVKSEPSSPSMGKRLTGILHMGRRKNNSISEPADAPVMDVLAEEATTPSESQVPAEGETPPVTGVPATNVTDGAKHEPSSSTDATSKGKRLTGILSLARRKNNSTSEAAGTSDSPAKDAPAEEDASTAGVETAAIEASSNPVVDAAKQEPSSSDGSGMGKRLNIIHSGILNLTRRKNNSTSESSEIPDKTAQAKDVVTTDVSEAPVAEEPAMTAVEVVKSEPSSSDSISMGKRLTGILSLSKRKSSSMTEAADAAADAKDAPLEETVTTAGVETPVGEGAATPETKSETKGKRFAGILNLMKPKSSPNKASGSAETTVKDLPGEEVASAVVEASAADVAEVLVTEGPKVVPTSTNVAVVESEEVEPPTEGDTEAPVDASGETLEVTPATEVVAESETPTEPEAQSDAIAGSESTAADPLESVIEAVAPLTEAVAADETDAAIKIESPDKPAKGAEPVEAKPKLEADAVKTEAASPEKISKEVAPEKLHKRNKSLTLFNMFVKQETAKTEPVFEATKDDTELAPIEAPKQRTRSSMSFLGCLSKPKAIEA